MVHQPAPSAHQKESFLKPLQYNTLGHNTLNRDQTLASCSTDNPLHYQPAPQLSDSDENTLNCVRYLHVLLLNQQMHMIWHQAISINNQSWFHRPPNLINWKSDSPNFIKKLDIIFLTLKNVLAVNPAQHHMVYTRITIIPRFSCHRSTDIRINNTQI